MLGVFFMPLARLKIVLCFSSSFFMSLFHHGGRLQVLIPESLFVLAI